MKIIQNICKRIRISNYKSFLQNIKKAKIIEDGKYKGYKNILITDKNIKNIMLYCDRRKSKLLRKKIK